MDRIINCEMLDIIPHDEGFLFIEKETLADGNVRAKFVKYNQDRNELLPIPSRVYLEHKFGSSYREIVKSVGDFISCDCAQISNNGAVTLFENGDMTIFNADGSAAWSGMVTYQDEPVRSLAVEGKSIWCTVPNRNSIILYSPLDGRVLLRIGGGKSVAFANPVSVKKYDDKLYISNKDSCKIRTIRLDDYSVKDYLKFKEPVFDYFRTNGSEYVVLESGVYIV